jgi:hypothetical protein
MTKARADDSKSGAHISAGHFGDRRAWLQASVSARGVDNGPSGPILDAAARLQKFRLRKYTAGAFPEISQLDDGCAADQV